MSTAQEQVGAALITRTEYRTGLADARRTVRMTLLLGAAPLLAALVLFGAAPGVVVAIVAAMLTGWLVVAATGPRTPPAVRLGLVDEQVIIGTDGGESEDTVQPLSELTAVELSSAPASSTQIDPPRRDLRIAGAHYLRLTFVDGMTHQVAVTESDPVATEILRRLRTSLGVATTDAVQAEPSVATKASAPKGRDPERARAAAPHNPPSASPAADARLWEAARTTHRRVLSEYGAYELDPTLFLRYPGVTDITRDPVMDFHTALAEAQALATETYPDDAAYAGRYRHAVDVLRRTWIRCERDGKATGTQYLSETDRSDLDTAAKLYNHAQATDHAAEKTSYLRKAQQLIVDLEARGRVHLPRPVVAAIEAQVRLALEAKPTTS